MTIRKAVCIRSIFAVAGLLVLTGAITAGGQERKKPSIAVRATPTAGFSPLRVFVSAEIKGGDNDFADFYCPTIEWVWGDETRSESTSDCDPYEIGKSEIRRRYSMTRTFPMAGTFKVELRLKQKDKIVGIGSTTVVVKPGLRDGMDR